MSHNALLCPAGEGRSAHTSTTSTRPLIIFFSRCFRGTQREASVSAAARVLRGRLGPGLRLRARSAHLLVLRRPPEEPPELTSPSCLRFPAGDLMGRAMKNLDRLLAMPYGCGEQNMVLFAPNIFILNYLRSTAQLSPDVLEKATRFLESGECQMGPTTPPPPVLPPPP